MVDLIIQVCDVARSAGPSILNLKRFNIVCNYESRSDTHTLNWPQVVRVLYSMVE